MKRLLLFLFVISLSSSLFSCGTGMKASQDATVFSTKDKKEVVRQNILKTKKKTYVAAP